MDKLLKNCLDTLYLPSFLNKSGIYYTTNHTGCHCSKAKSACQHLLDEIPSRENEFTKLNVREESSPRRNASSLDHLRSSCQKSFTDRRQIYEDSHVRRSKSLNRNHSSFVESEECSGDWGENAILDSELDIDSLYALCEFRERNRAECMSASNRLRYRKMNRNKFGVGHKCLHKYQVNEKLQPVPRLANSRGESLCEICGGISKYLQEHTVNEIIARDPHLGGAETPIVVVEMPRREKLTSKPMNFPQEP